LLARTEGRLPVPSPCGFLRRVIGLRANRRTRPLATAPALVRGRCWPHRARWRDGDRSFHRWPGSGARARLRPTRRDLLCLRGLDFLRLEPALKELGGRVGHDDRAIERPLLDDRLLASGARKW